MISSKQCVLNAVNHKESDRIPITFDAEHEVYDALYRHFGVTSKEKLFDMLHVDTWMVLPKNFQFFEGQEEQEIKTSIWGYKCKRTHYSGGVYDELFESPLAGKNDLCDIYNHHWPSKDVLGFSHFPQEIRTHQERAIIGVFTWGAYFIATHVRGIQDLLMDFAIRPRYADHLITTIADISLQCLQTLLDQFGDGIDIVFMADDYCSQKGPLFSPQAFKKFVVPYLSKFVEHVHRYDKKFLLHVCGAVRPLLPMIIDCGVDMLEPIQTRAVGMEPEGLKRDFGKDICFYGGMDLQQVLCNGTPQQVADEAKRLIDVLGKDGGYVFGPGHTYIQIDAPIKNIITMYETAFNYHT